jgi:peroxiredoxin
LRQDHAEFTLRHTQVIVIGPDSAAAFKAYWETHHLPFIGLPDPRFSVLRLYGQEVNLLKLGRMPAQVLVDKRGCARFVHYGKSMSDIPTDAELIQQIDEVDQETTDLAGS